MGVCVHPDVTLRKMDEIGRGHDSVVLQWMEAISQCMEQQRTGDPFTSCTCASACVVNMAA